MRDESRMIVIEVLTGTFAAARDAHLPEMTGAASEARLLEFLVAYLRGAQLAGLCETEQRGDAP